MMTRGTLLFLKGVVGQVVISAGQPGFHELYRSIAVAVAEIDEALATEPDAAHGEAVVD